MTYGYQSTAEEVTQGLELSGQTWLITGVNSGLGYESARVLGARGARIVGAARTEAKAAEALRALGIDGLPLACELSDLDAVQAAVARVRADGTPLAGILANAGIMALPDLQQERGIELQFYTNHVGHFALVTGLLDQLTADGRVVMLSSGAHFLAKRGLELDNLSGERDYDPWRMYGRSKLANILFARSLASRFAGTGRTANAVHPGVIQTNLARHIDDPETMFASLRNRLKTVAQGAATQCYVAVNPAARGISGAYFVDCAVAESLPEAKDDLLAAALWDATEALVQRGARS
jgi:NAD(P)-dependent dehydrogenase (short-subunit alcohol dehydrogenase family)